MFSFLRSTFRPETNHLDPRTIEIYEKVKELAQYILQEKEFKIHSLQYADITPKELRSRRQKEVLVDVAILLYLPNGFYEPERMDVVFSIYLGVAGREYKKARVSHYPNLMEFKLDEGEPRIILTTPDAQNREDRELVNFFEKLRAQKIFEFPT